MPYLNTETKSAYYDAILNGVEILKASDNKGNLAGPNPKPLPTQDRIDAPPVPDIWLSEQKCSRSSKNTGVVAGSVVGGIIAIGLILFTFFVSQKCRGATKSNARDENSGWSPFDLVKHAHSANSSKERTTSSVLPSDICRRFSFAEIKLATNNFDMALILEVGGFGKVYKGEVDSGTTKVAVKRGNPLSDQGVHEFQTESEMLSKLRHRHLVSLIGYCEENSEMILVYDYMAYGTLRGHLYKTQKPPY